MHNSALVFGCIAPHGAEIIPELAGEQPARMGLSRNSLTRLGREMGEERPDTIIYLTPHGIRANNAFSVTDCERMSGSLEENDCRFAVSARVDRELACRIADEARADNLPVAQLNYATSSGPLSCLPLDWGVLVPLRFMPHVPIVVVTTCCDLPYAQHVAFGVCLARAAGGSGKRIGVVASCDWAHAHNEAGPYGYDPAAAQLDEMVVQLVGANDLEGLAGFDKSFVDAAKPDGIWQALILDGAVPASSREIDVLSYEAPTYFGLLCAAVRRL
jgi:aromatic ring-opening dioxygenase LigB subunit